MTRFVVGRLLALIPLSLGVAILVFVVLHILPGDAALILAGQEGNLQQLEVLREQLGLNDPLPIRFVSWLKDLASANFGKSLRTNLPVRDELFVRIPPTIQLAFGAMLFSIILGIPLGVVAASHRNAQLDLLLRLIGLLGLSVPSFWLAILLVLLFAVNLQILPSIGFASIWQSPWDAIRFTTLPALALALPQTAVIMRFTRSAMLEVLEQDYIRTARAKGLTERSVVYSHALRNALIGVVTVIGIQMGHLLGGSVIVETIFQWPGVGYAVFQAISSRDYPLAQGVVLFTALFFALVTLLVDVLYALIDPRIRFD